MAKFLNYEDRLDIESGLKAHMTFTELGEKLGRDRTTITKEIRYCNPSAPYQKAEIEVGHEFIRRIVPKGRSFDELTQADIELMMNHINSYRRKKLNGKSPYEAFCFYYGEDLAERLGCREVAAKDINLTARLLKK